MDVSPPTSLTTPSSKSRQQQYDPRPPTHPEHDENSAPIDIEAIASQKENIEPLSTGRSARILHSVLSASKSSLTLEMARERAKFEAEVRAWEAYELGELVEEDEVEDLTLNFSKSGGGGLEERFSDPLDIYHRYIRYVLKTHPSGPTAESCLINLLETCTRRFSKDPRYKSDQRYLKLWCLYAKYTEIPEVIYPWLWKNGIGDRLATLYEEWAALEEARGNRTEADKIYHIGINLPAFPIERIKKRYADFQIRMLRLPASNTPPNGQSEGEERRRTVRPILGPSLLHPQNPGSQPLLSSAAPAARKAPANSSRIAVFEDPEDGPVSAVESLQLARGVEEGSDLFGELGTMKNRRKENIVEASKWTANGAALGNMGGGGAMNPLGGSKLEVFCDEDADPLPASTKQRPSGSDPFTESIRAGPTSHEVLKKNPFSNYKVEDFGGVSGLLDPNVVIEIPDGPHTSGLGSGSDKRRPLEAKKSSKSSSSRDPLAPRQALGASSTLSNPHPKPSSSTSAPSKPSSSSAEPKKERTAVNLRLMYPEDEPDNEYCFEEMMAKKRGLWNRWCTGEKAEVQECEMGTIYVDLKTGRNQQVDPTRPFTYPDGRRWTPPGWVSPKKANDEERPLVTRQSRSSEVARTALAEVPLPKLSPQPDAAEPDPPSSPARLEGGLDNATCPSSSSILTPPPQAARGSPSALQVYADEDDRSIPAEIQPAEPTQAKALQVFDDEEEINFFGDNNVAVTPSSADPTKPANPQALKVFADDEADSELFEPVKPTSPYKPTPNTRTPKSNPFARPLVPQSASAPSQPALPSPTINTKAALEEVNDLFGKTMKFDKLSGHVEDDEETEDEDEDEEGEDDFFNFGSQPRSQSQQSGWGSQSQPQSQSQGRGDDLDFLGDEEEEGEEEGQEGEEDRDDEVDVFGPRQSFKPMRSGSSSKLFEVAPDADDEIAHSALSPASSRPPIQRTASSSSTSGGSSLRTPLGQKGGAGVGSDAFELPLGSAIPSGLQQVEGDFLSFDDDLGQPAAREVSTVDSAGFDMGRRGPGGNRFAMMMDVMTPITERTCEFTNMTMGLSAKTSLSWRTRPLMPGHEEEDEEDGGADRETQGDHEEDDFDRAFVEDDLRSSVGSAKHRSRSGAEDSHLIPDELIMLKDEPDVQHGNLIDFSSESDSRPQTQGTGSLDSSEEIERSQDSDVSKSFRSLNHSHASFQVPEGYTITNHAEVTSSMVVVDKTSTLTLDDNTNDDRDFESKELYAPPEDATRAFGKRRAGGFQNPCNPFDEEVVNAILAVAEPPVEAQPGFRSFPGTYAGKLAGLKKNAEDSFRKSVTGRRSRSAEEEDWVVVVGGDVFSVRGQLGEGTFGLVFRVRESGNLLDIESTVSMALKVEAPANLWEFHILRQLQRRLAERYRNSVIAAHRHYVHADESFMLLDYVNQGTLLDAVNHAADAGIAPNTASVDTGLDEIVAMFFAVELLRVIEAFHNAGFIHGDFKIDNCLVRLENVPDKAWSSAYDPSGGGGWDSKGVKIIDFGRTIDLLAFEPGQKFIADWKTDQHDCFEMREARPWTYEPDYFGLAGVVYSMLFRNYMETTTVPSTPSSSFQNPNVKTKHIIKHAFKRYHQQDLWTHLFDALLNPRSVRPDGSVPITSELAVIRGEMETWLVANCEKNGKSLKGLLKKLEIRSAGSW